MQEFLVVDMRAILDLSQAGREGAGVLEKQWNEAAAKAQGIREQAKTAAGPAQKAIMEQLQNLEKDTTAGIEKKREELRAKVLERAQAVMRPIVESRGAKLVLDRGGIIWCSPENDITQDVIAKVDAMGPIIK